MNIAIDIHNNVYWTENGRIRKKDKETSMITVIFVFSSNFYSNFVMDNSQNIYFFNVNMGNIQLHKYNVNTCAITNFMIPVIPKGNIYGIVLDNNTGDIFFTSEEIHSVYKTNISGKEPVTKISDNFKKPWGIAHDKSLNCLYIVDKGDNCIKRIDLNTNIDSIYAGASQKGNNYNVLKEDAFFNEPTDVDLDGFGNMFICDYTNNQIKRIDSSGMVTLFAGSGAYGKSNGFSLQESTFCNPVSILIKDRTMYIADEGNKSVRMITGSYQ